MRLIIVGATGFVATEVIRQSLRLKEVTEVIALARRPVSAPADLYPYSDTTKLKSVVLEDYAVYGPEVTKQLTGAGACIWTVAVTPSKVTKMDFKEVRRVCYDCTIAGVEAIMSMRSKESGPLRFAYISATAVTREENEVSKFPNYMPEYTRMRGDVERYLGSYQASHRYDFSLCVLRPGLIKAADDWKKWIVGGVLKMAIGLPNIDVTEISACALQQVIHGIEKDPLTNDEMALIGRNALEKEAGHES